MKGVYDSKIINQCLFFPHTVRIKDLDKLNLVKINNSEA